MNGHGMSVAYKHSPEGAPQTVRLLRRRDPSLHPSSKQTLAADRFPRSVKVRDGRRPLRGRQAIALRQNNAH